MRSRLCLLRTFASFITRGSGQRTGFTSECQRRVGLPSPFNEGSVQALRKYGMWRVEGGPVRGCVKGVWCRLDVKLNRVDCGIVKSDRDGYKVGYAL